MTGKPAIGPSGLAAEFSGILADRHAVSREAAQTGWSVNLKRPAIASLAGHFFAAIQLSKNKKSGCDWFLHETGATAPETKTVKFVLLLFGSGNTAPAN